MNIVCYKNIIFYKGEFYTNKENIKTAYTHNARKIPFSPLDIETLKLDEIPELFDKGILLLEAFHWNMGHAIWDSFYPSWYGLYYNYTEYSLNGDFQWITRYDIEDIHVSIHKDIAEKFSGNIVYSLKNLSDMYNKPIIIPWLITGLENIGISNVNKNNLCVEKGIEINNIDPIEAFINRMYSKYDIKRNTSLKNHINICNNIIYIINKRKYLGIEELFEKFNNKYSAKYNFKIINYENYSFKEQLEILNKTCLCVVGVGTARTNTPFLPNGAVEIQTFDHNILNKNFITYFDYHIGTLSNYVKVINIPYYTQEEAINNKCSKYLEEYIEKGLNIIPCLTPVNLEENIPLEIIEVKNYKYFDIMFDVWRYNLSNVIEDLFTLLRSINNI